MSAAPAAISTPAPGDRVSTTTPATATASAADGMPASAARATSAAAIAAISGSVPSASAASMPASAAAAQAAHSQAAASTSGAARRSAGRTATMPTIHASDTTGRWGQTAVSTPCVASTAPSAVSRANDGSSAARRARVRTPET
jgi:hypothetical protein